jgi:large subunit ribosomal protein L44
MVVVVRKAGYGHVSTLQRDSGIAERCAAKFGTAKRACAVFVRNKFAILAVYSQYFAVYLLIFFLLMSHVQKRLVTTAAKLASLSTTNLAKFPPKQAFIVKSDVPQPTFNPEIWASLQPPPPPALSAFAHRIGLASILTSTDLIQQACTHPSFTALYSQHYPRETPPSTNAQLVILGNSLLGLFATEYLNAKYPYLPTRVQKAALTAHVGPATCASIAQEMGATPLVRWHRTVRFFLLPEMS